jgi:hypothetical protein
MAAKRVNKNTPTTIFDLPAIPAELRKAGVKDFAKVVASKDNEELMKKYGAAANTLVVCAPTGDKLLSFSGAQCTQANITSTLKNFPAQYAAWQKAKK